MTEKVAIRGADERTSIDLQNRLPSFDEVLFRKTRPPVDLFMFYLFLQHESAEDVLDFWLDVHQHENLCRAYFKDVRKSGRTIREDWPQYYEYARRRGSIYGTVATTKRDTGSAGDLEKAAEANRDYTRSVSPRPPTSTSATHNPNPPTTQTRKSTEGHVQLAVAEDGTQPKRSGTSFSARRLSLGRSFSKRASRAPTIIPRDSAITRTDLIASAERIYLRYLAPGAPKEIYLPAALRIHNFPLSSASLPQPALPEYEIESSALAQVPDMFHQQKEYVFRAMEQDAFPRFLRAKAFGNLTPVGALVRLCVGLLVLWVGLATAFSLIFLDVKPKSKRFFLFIPFALAVLFLVSHQYELDPILVFLGQSETTPFRAIRIREPYVNKLLLGRALWVMFLVLLGVVVLTMLFWAVPGHRL
ncbi:regulator of G protein signaling [Cantharellus anzutake]|uniref:regulator of G protein signaling n=1 Tax=Cantharellus anzutake TaxID=1750568 RepID=UPI001905C55A|nr:regulator of G protein signaling [Cantharellus anzutake]XP_038913141.1 regulator of G protein signaling [Cantharellus anzutake]KAF8321940.1 regulator of G protein signaling [Cantharellus anzutake]KAF8326811.1 regulator of G protein signaling [Cantharellus anzutake]